MATETDDETPTWEAFVEASSGLGSIPGETEADAREYIETYVDTGHLGPVRIRALQREDEDEDSGGEDSAD